MATQSTVTDRSADVTDAEANVIIRQNVLWAAGGGLIPVPILDVVAITAVELKMLKELASVYGVSFREDQAKSILASLLAGLGAPLIGGVLAGTLGKAIPVVGYLTAIFAVPGSAAAFTYAVGKVFVQHFASGGTFLDFDPKKVRQHFAREFQEGKVVAEQVKSESSQERG